MDSSNRDFVTRLQEALIRQGFNVAVDGIWGNQTDDALDLWAAKDPDLCAVTDLEQAKAVIARAEYRPNDADPRLFRGVPHAVPISRGIWPLRSTHPKAAIVSHVRSDGRVVGNGGRAFGATRTTKRKTAAGEVRTIRRFHCGVDLYANEGDPVMAIVDGVVRRSYVFVKGRRKDGSKYAVSCLLIESVAGGAVGPVLNYAEVDTESISVSVNDRVVAGQQIAAVGKMRVSSMLHFEAYAAGETLNRRWYRSRKPPRRLLDPTSLLLDLRDQTFAAEEG